MQIGNTTLPPTTKVSYIVIGALSLALLCVSTPVFSAIDATYTATESDTEQYADSDALGPYGDENDEYVADEEEAQTPTLVSWPEEPAMQNRNRKNAGDFAARAADERDIELQNPGYGTKMQDDDA